MRASRITAIAALMNKLFVNIKVDREERPDLDTIYQQALALLGQQGGWPLTMFLTPDGRPFWGGTYFPQGGALRPARLRRCAELRLPRSMHKEPEKVRPTSTACAEAMQKLSTPQARRRDLRRHCSTRSPSACCEEVDLEQGRHRLGAEISAAADLHAAVARLEAHRGRAEFRDAVTVTLTQMARAASTIISAAASRAIRSMPIGWCRISRRCSTTMPS